MAIIDQEPRSATLRAKTNAKVAKVDQKRFLFMVQNTPYFALFMLRLMASRMRSSLDSKAPFPPTEPRA